MGMQKRTLVGWMLVALASTAAQVAEGGLPSALFKNADVKQEDAQTPAPAQVRAAPARTEPAPPRPAPAKPAPPRSAPQPSAPRFGARPGPAVARIPQRADTGRARVRLARLEISGVQVRQADAYSGSAQLGWVPDFAVTPSLLIVFSLGGTFLKGTAQDLFPVADLALLADYSLARDFAVAAGGGAQFWISHGGLAPLARVSLGWKPGGGNHWFLDRVFLGYSRTFAVVPSNQFQLGVGFHLL